MPNPDGTRFTTASDERDRVLNPVADCPFCRSTRVATASKTVSDSTYWRCLACGEIWNPTRARVSPRTNRWGW